jgi:hypothetical protein
MNKLTAAQSLARLPHKQYLSLREVWKDLKLFNTVLSAAAPKKPLPKIKMVVDPLDTNSIKDLKKAGVKKPVNVVPVKAPRVSNRKAVEPPSTPAPRVAVKPDLPVASPKDNKEDMEYETGNAPKVNLPMDSGPARSGPIETIKIDPADHKQIGEHNDRLGELYKQKEILSNVINTLQSGFANISDDTTDNIGKAVKYASNLAKIIDSHIADIRTSLHNSTKSVMPQNFTNLVTNVTNNTRNKLNKPGKNDVTTMFSSGVDDTGSLVLTAFIIFKNVKTPDGITPIYVIAISLRGQYFYINPTLLRVPAINQFRLGTVLKNDNSIAKQAKILIDEHFAFMGQMDALNTIPIPPLITGMSLTNLKNVETVVFEDASLLITFKSTIQAANQASEAANNLYVIFSNALQVKHAKDGVKPRYTIGQDADTKKWFVLFAFSKQNSMSGRSLDRDEIDYLSKIFTREDVGKIRYVLSNVKAA